MKVALRIDLLDASSAYITLYDEFWVLPDSCVDIILGMAFLKKHKAKLDLSTDCIEVSGKRDLSDPKALADPTNELWIPMTPKQTSYTAAVWNSNKRRRAGTADQAAYLEHRRTHSEQETSETDGDASATEADESACEDDDASDDGNSDGQTGKRNIAVSGFCSSMSQTNSAVPLCAVRTIYLKPNHHMYVPVRPHKNIGSACAGAWGLVLPVTTATTFLTAKGVTEIVQTTKANPRENWVQLCNTTNRTICIPVGEHVADFHRKDRNLYTVVDWDLDVEDKIDSYLENINEKRTPLGSGHR
jgi:hypothetical protein